MGEKFALIYVINSVFHSCAINIIEHACLPLGRAERDRTDFADKNRRELANLDKPKLKYLKYHIGTLFGLGLSKLGVRD